MAKKPKQKASNDIFDGHGKATAAEVKARLEQFERDQEEARQKFLAEQVEPIRQRIVLLKDQRNGIEREIGKLEQTLAELTGRPVAPFGRRRKRVTAQEKLILAQMMYEALKSKKGTKFRGTDLEAKTEGVKARELVKLWNQTHKDQKISVEGEKSKTRYFVA